MTMDKYGVDQEGQAKDKTAAKGRVCPECGKTLDPNTTALKCPTHGTQPFERRPEDDASQSKEDSKQKGE